MRTNDQMMVDHRYPADLDYEKYSFSKQQQQSSAMLSKEEDGNTSQGRRVYLESPSFGNKEEEDLYRYVPSRLTDRTASILGTNFPAPTGGTLMDSLDFDLDILGANHPRSELPYRQPSKPVIPTRQLPRSDPRQDPLLGPLLAELDAMSTQQPLPPPTTPPHYRRNSLPYQTNLLRPVGSTSSNHALTNIANRTVNDALLEAELYQPLDRKDQQQRQTLPVSAPNLNQSRPSNMDETDIFVPSSYSTGPGTFLSHFGPEDQLFQRPLLNTLGQNYVPNPRPPQQRDISYDQPSVRVPPPQRTAYVPPRNQLHEQPLPPSSNPFIEYERAPPQQRQEERHPHEMFFTDQNEEQIEQQQSTQRTSEQQDPDSRRQAVWNELQRTNAKTQEKNAKKHESPTRNRAPFGSSLHLNNSGSQQSSAGPKSPQRPFHHPPPPLPVSKSNYVDENIDMIKNKENFFHRYPARKYENSYAKRKDLHSGGGGGGGYEKQEQEPKIQSSTYHSQRQTSLPITVNLNTGENPQSGSSGTIAIPVDSHINRVGDKISVNIDLRLVDIQNMQQQQQQGIDHPQWGGGDPLDRHIRKLERNIEQSLPITHPPQRSPVIPTTGMNTTIGRYGKQTTGMSRGGYNPPVYGGGDYYNYGDRGREEDSYLSKLNATRKHPQFKPYTGRDYDQFKKNYGFGTGHLAYDFENTTHKEKSEQLAKTRQYAQQIEARNKKKLSVYSRRTLSDTRLPKAPRPLEYPPSAIRKKQLSGKSTYSSPAILSEGIPYIPARRPTEVLYRPVPIQRPPSKLPELQFNEVIEREKIPEKLTLKSPPKRRVEQERTVQRRLSPPKRLPPMANNNPNVSKRRPIRFDNEPTPRETRPPEPPSNPQNEEEKMVMDLIRQELKEKPLNSNEE